MRLAPYVEIEHSDWLLQFGGVLIRLRDHVTHGYLDRIAPPQIATNLESHPIINKGNAGVFVVHFLTSLTSIILIHNIRSLKYFMLCPLCPS